MRSFITRLTATALAAGLGAFAAEHSDLAGLKLPAQNLQGEPRVFPIDVAQRRAVVVVTFSKSASDEASEWTRRLRENQQKLAANIYQIVILEDVPALFRSFVISGLRRAIPKDLHDNFWIATSSSKEWQTHTGSRSLDEAHVFILEDRSQITWRFHGAFSETKFRSLLAVLSERKN